MSQTATFPHTPNVLPAPSQVLVDTALFIWLQARRAAGETVLVAHAKDLLKVCIDQTGAETFIADPEDQSKDLLKALAKAKRLTHIAPQFDELDNATHRVASWQSQACTTKEIQDVLKARTATFGLGRGKPISDATKREVWNASAGRCMYTGCSTDLTKTPLVSKHTNISYLAHIIASDPDGPRGNPRESHALSDDPENIMLMCDAHHRLIDRLDKAGHPAERLRAMRKERCDTLRILLDNLSFPRTQAITLLADVANVATVASDRDVRAAMYQQKTNPLPAIAGPINRSLRDGRTAPGFWNHVLHEHENDFREARRLLAFASTGNGALKPERIAVFPLMTVPMLVLCGRMAGQASAIDVYQYDRDRETWQWDSTKSSQPPGTFLTEQSFSGQIEEVLISIELTAALDISRLPAEIQKGLSEKRIAQVRITTQTPHRGCVGHPEDLEQFSAVAANALKHVTDVLRAKKIHVIGLAPASSLFRFGQMLQAGHHPDCTIYDHPDLKTGFLPALFISGEQVTSAEVNASNPITLSLR